MSMRLKNIVMLLLALAPVLSQKIAAQTMPKSFTEDNVKFIEEMRDFFESNDQKKGREYIDLFNEQYWITGKISADMKTAIYKNTNAMAKKKFKPSPEYYAYFNTIKTIFPSGLRNAALGSPAGKFDSIRTEPGQTHLEACAII